MNGFISEVGIAAIAAATASVASLIAAFLKMRQERNSVHVSVGGRHFEIENVDPQDIDAVLAEVSRQAHLETRSHGTLAGTHG